VSKKEGFQDLPLTPPRNSQALWRWLQNSEQDKEIADEPVREGWNCWAYRDSR
jgi:hypothetical protein